MVGRCEKCGPIVHNGLIPVFVDCEVGTYNINPHRLNDAVSKKTRAIMIPHTLGNPCDMDIVQDVVKRHHLYLIEDSCDALGATFRGQLVGTFGDLATLSFFPSSARARSPADVERVNPIRNGPAIMARCFEAELNMATYWITVLALWTIVAGTEKPSFFAALRFTVSWTWRALV